MAKPAADRRPEVELHPAELSLNPRRENGSRADRPGRETAPASGPAPPGFARDRVRVETKSPLWEVVAGLYRREVNRLGPPLVNFGWRFSRDMVERAEAILATTG
ncbi:hypothetical protein IY145_17865 [Methylosinus sp. H3A]|uniref:hypothetical protein n=1 Tax=Methylosinus sp. H3A TaxID=2785786 RepID=UPI0018C2DA0F|nr:hypothetical protein [Methylosinus sp. H3A]MBG0811225.1 hypothetical protein [Methylosinus sp. H3A]